MKSVPKLIRRFVAILLLSFILLLILNFILLAIFVSQQAPNSSPWITAQQVSENLYPSKDNSGYHLPDELSRELKRNNIWAVFIDNSTMQVSWQTDTLPETIPKSYTVSDIAALTRGYIDGYPTFTGESPNGLVVLGYPRDSFWKHMWPSWDYQTIAHMPQIVITVFAVNVLLIFIIYITANSKLLKAVKPIADGIQALPAKEDVYVKEKGLMSELAMSINQTSEILQLQRNQLHKKETARANWIAGVSHDIRTPLSMIMGYAGQLKEAPHLTDEERQKAAVIVKQSGRMKNLINDLNLASKLEYNMQPIHLQKENMVAIVRQVVVDFINMDIDEKHPIEWETDEALMICAVEVDKNLIKRAVSNLIQNSINHNEQGCNIHISVAARDGQCIINISDDGTGTTDEQIKKLGDTPHYMVCDENTTEQRHGLGLMIVKQIVAAHGGKTAIGHSPSGGFSVELIFPMEAC